MRVKIAGVQMTCSGDLEENLGKAAKMAEMAAEGGASVVCFEPMFNTLWFPREAGEEGLGLAEGEDGPTLEAMKSAAAKFGVCLVLPLYERAPSGRYYTAFVIGDGGEVKGRYRKVHLPDIPLWRERFYFAPGDLGYPVFEHRGLRFGVQICWDNFFPEGVRSLALAGAQLVLAPTAAAFYSHHKWETVLAAAAITNGVFLMRVNRVGREEGQDFYGRSFCVDPDGEFIIGPVGLNEGVIMAELDLGLVEQVRGQWSFLDGRRPETYSRLVEGETAPPGGRE